MNYTMIYDIAVLMFRIYVGYYFIPKAGEK